MAEIRQARLLIRDKQTTGGALPANALYAEPFVNLYDGVLKFSGVTGGVFEPSDVDTVFEVGSTLYNSRITNRLTINDNFIISGDTGQISTYGGTTGAGLIGKFLSGTTDGFVLADIEDIEGVKTRVQPGINTFTGGTPDNPTINVVDSPSFDSISFSGLAEGGDAIFEELSASTIYSGSTDLYSIFLTAADVSATTVSSGANVIVSNVGIDYEVSVVDSPSLNNITFSGTANGGSVNVDDITATAVTINSGNFDITGGGVLQSGGTDLYSIFLTANDGNDITRVQPGANTVTGGTANEPIVNVVDSPSFDNITFSGTANGGNVNVDELTATAVTINNGNFDITGGGILQSGGTDLYSIFVTEDTSDITRVQPGTNITTGGTANDPIINTVDSPTFNDITFSGTANGGSVNVDDIVATGITNSSLTAGRVVYVGAGGELVDEAGFEYDDTDDLLKTGNIQIGNPGDSGTTATIYGDILVIGEAISGFTSELYIEDNLIELNYNPTASTASSSIGAGWLIQDGSGIAGTDAFFDIRGASTGVVNRGFATNLNDIYIREDGTTSSPGGVRVIAETDIIDGGSY